MVSVLLKIIFEVFKISVSESIQKVFRLQNVYSNTSTRPNLSNYWDHCVRVKDSHNIGGQEGLGKINRNDTHAISWSSKPQLVSRLKCEKCVCPLHSIIALWSPAHRSICYKTRNAPTRSLTRVKIVRFGHFNLRVGPRLELSDRIAAFADDRAGSDARNQDFHVIHSIWIS